jgi:predicted dehydrogenase
LQQLITQTCCGGIQSIQYDFTRVGRTDDDFSTTAIHGIDTTRFLAGSDYATVHYHYQTLPHSGRNVANVFMDCTFVSGARAQLSFYPVAGAVTERASIQALDHSFYLSLPIWNGFDAPGRLQHVFRGTLVSDQTGPEVTGSAEDYVLNGFYGESESFLDEIRTGGRPRNDLRSARQSVAVAEYMRERVVEHTFPP